MNDTDHVLSDGLENGTIDILDMDPVWGMIVINQLLIGWELSN